MRKIIASIFALLTINTLGAMVVEIFIAGMAFNQSLNARLIAIPVIIIVAWPYGQLRDWLFKVMKAEEKGMVYKSLADILAFIGVQVPQYLFVLKLSGATTQQMITACGMVTALSGFAGRPTGLFLDFSRWLFKVKKEPQENS
jgi:hypothetical protein